MNKINYSRLKIGQIIDVQAYKHNGQLYRQWNGVKVLFNNSEKLVLIMWKVKVEEYGQKHWGYKEPVIWFFPKKDFYNALILLKKTGHYTYINIASTPLFEDDTLKYVDYDFDIKLHPKKELKLVDREEFHNNFVAFNYPEKIKKISYHVISKIFQMFNDYEEIFNPKVIEYFIKLAVKDKSFNATVLNDFIKHSGTSKVELSNKISIKKSSSTILKRKPNNRQKQRQNQNKNTTKISPKQNQKDSQNNSNDFTNKPIKEANSNQNQYPNSNQNGNKTQPNDAAIKQNKKPNPNQNQNNNNKTPNGKFTKYYKSPNSTKTPNKNNNKPKHFNKNKFSNSNYKNKKEPV